MSAKWGVVVYKEAETCRLIRWDTEVRVHLHFGTGVFRVRVLNHL